MTIDFDAQANLADLRMRVLAGDTISPDEYRTLILDLMRGRDMAAAHARADAALLRKAKAAPKPAPSPLNLQEVLDQLN